MLVLALESSTSAAKALLFDTETGVVDVATEPYGPAIDSDGTQDTDAVFHATIHVGRTVAQGKKIAAVAICGTWHSIAVLSKQMQPMTRTFSWAHMGASAMCKRIRADEALTASLYQRTGCMPHVTYVRHTLAHLKEQGLTLTDKLFASQGSYNFYQLTGAFVESRSTAAGSGFLNIHTKEYDPFVLDMVGIKAPQLGSLVTYQDTRPLNSTGAALLGVPEGIPVVPPHPDGALTQVGSGAAQVGRMTFSVGTSAAIRLATDRPVLPEKRQTWCYLGADGWIAGAATAGAGNCINWFKDTCLDGRWDFSKLEQDDNLRDVPVFLPFLFGERCPGWMDDRRGGFAGLKPEHTVYDLYKGLQAGIIFNVFQCYQALCEIAGEPEVILVSGGVLYSERWTQMIADIFQRPIACLATTQASALGCAALAAHAAGALRDINDFGHEDNLRLVNPRCNFARYYTELYERYCLWYDKTK